MLYAVALAAALAAVQAPRERLEPAPADVILPGDRSLADTNGVLAGLLVRLREDPSLLGVIAGGLPTESRAAPSLLPGVSGRRLLKKATRAFDRAIVESGRYQGSPPQPGETINLLLPGTGIRVIRSVFPGVRVSETEERERLTVTLWACPDRVTALALYWIRQGGEAAYRSGFYNPLAGADAHGERSFWYHDDWIFNAPLRKDDPRAGGEREGFIRGNVIVEASTWTYTTALGGGWRAAGMVGVAPEYHRLLAALDRYVIAQMDGSRQ